jgi:acetylornithine deacetylase/succinyl-diaminopimelate desuccinylase-like protein
MLYSDGPGLPSLRRIAAQQARQVLGPGEAAMAHQTDEYASQERIRQSVALYEALIRDWVTSS